MDSDSAPDLLSELPVDVIENILRWLPIRDAVKTSVLSSKWRYRWATLPYLIFDPSITNRVETGTQILLLHKGPIHQFKLYTHYQPDCPNFEPWLLFLSRKDIKELTLAFRPRHFPIMLKPRLPSFIFSFSVLTRLELENCEMNPPPTFKGYSYLKSLKLRLVSVPRRELEYIISHCPLLEEFSWGSNDTSLDMTIHAPNLKYLHLMGRPGKICLGHSSQLVEIDIVFFVHEDVQKDSACGFSKLLGGLINLKCMIGHCDFVKVLSAGIDHFPASSVYHHLKLIRLGGVNFNSIDEIYVVFRLMMSSPNLSTLEVMGVHNAKNAPGAPDTYSWHTMLPSNCTFKQLRVLELTRLSGLANEIIFILFMIRHSPALESMVIKPRKNLADDRNLIIESLRSHLASLQLHAKVLFLQP